MAQKFLDLTGLQAFWTKIQEHLTNKYVSKDTNGNVAISGTLTVSGAITGNLTGNVTGNLTGNATSATTAESATTAGTATKVSKSLTIKHPGATNGVSFDGSTARTIDLTTLATVTNVSDAVKIVADDLDALEGTVSTMKGKVDAIEDNAEVNVIESISYGDKTATVSDKTATITFDSVLNTTSTNAPQTKVVNSAISSAITTAANNAVTTIRNGEATYTTLKLVGTKLNELDNTVAGLASATKFIGVKTSLPATGTAGDVVIVGNKEYIWDNTTDNVNGKAGWVELGDVTAEAARIKALEDWKPGVTEWQGDVTEWQGDIEDWQSTVNTDLSNLKNGTGTVKSFGGKTGAITVSTTNSSVTAGDSTKNGSSSVKFAMSNNNLTGSVALPKDIWTAAQSGANTNTIQVSVSNKVISANAVTAAPAENGTGLSTSGQIYTFVNNTVNSAKGNLVASTAISESTTAAANDGSTGAKTTISHTYTLSGKTATSAGSIVLESISVKEINDLFA